MRRSWLCAGTAAIVLAALAPSRGECVGLVAARGRDVQMPAIKAFIGWDGKTEELVVQPGFDGNAGEFGVIVPTPSQPEVSAAPRDFFTELGVFTQLKHREMPRSNLLPLREAIAPERGGRRFSGVRVLDRGVVGTLAVQVLLAEKPEELAGWLKEHQFQVEANDLAFYVTNKWYFTVARIDPQQLKKDPRAGFVGDLAPLRLTFKTDKPVLPLRLARGNVKESCEVTVYVQAATKVDLPAEQSYQYQWLPLLDASRGRYPKGTFPGGAELPGQGDDWLKAAATQRSALTKKSKELGFTFTPGMRPQPNKQGQTATTLEWAKRLTPADIDTLKGTAPYTEMVPDPDEGFTEADVRQARRAEPIFRTIEKRLEKLNRERPGGYLVRSAPAEDLQKLKELTPFLTTGQFLTRLRKPMTRDEMNGDLYFVPAELGPARDASEYEESLPP